MELAISDASHWEGGVLHKNWWIQVLRSIVTTDLAIGQNNSSNLPKFNILRTTILLDKMCNKKVNHQKRHQCLLKSELLTSKENTQVSKKIQSSSPSQPILKCLVWPKIKLNCKIRSLIGLCTQSSMRNKIFQTTKLMMKQWESDQAILAWILPLLWRQMVKLSMRMSTCSALSLKEAILFHQS